ncbi:solute carrier family 23 protein [Thiocapsa rosea]|uniref:Permease family protein n=1 Tax=Thiocapsa rosea TaxID=69360 RepID=A0A495VGI9_9GAMM|nr:solute carrier family 23 protein [Thiocapsa rosea]RKT47567.1 permease family protein [Thiocapsa rosea]
MLRAGSRGRAWSFGRAGFLTAERPPDLIYGIDERPPWLKALLVAVQHAAIICPTLVLVAIVVHAAGGSAIDSQQAMARGLVAIAIMTALQAIRLPGIGSGFFLPPVVTATYLPASLAAVAAGGLPLVFGMTLVAGAFQVFFSRTIGLLRKVFPAVVSGVILMAVGMELCRRGTELCRRTLGLSLERRGGSNRRPGDGRTLRGVARVQGVT